MAQLYFYYSAMNAGKSTALLQSSYNYQERGMRTLVLPRRLIIALGSERSVRVLACLHKPCFTIAAHHYYLLSPQSIRRNLFIVFYLMSVSF